MEILPEFAAQIAKEVYTVQNEFQLKVFLLSPIFSSSPHHNKSFKATVGGRLIHARDGFCVAARGGAGYEKDLFLMFRGSTTSHKCADWISNARCGVQSSPGGLVHIGFSHIFNSMCADIDNFIRLQMCDRANPVHTIHCIGHSLGGAVASLAADWARRTTFKHVVLYTFGAPKPGFEAFAKNLTTRLGPENIHRVYHATDPVPMIPIYPFTHAPLPGYGHFMGSADAVLSAAAHDMDKYIKSVQGATWKSMKGQPPAVGYDKVVEKWLESDGSLNPASADTWLWINAGLEYVIKQILGAQAVVLQCHFTGALSLADKIAWILYKGVEVTIEAGKWVLLLMRKMMQALHMKMVETGEELTRVLMRLVLERLMARTTQEAMKALQRLMNN